MLRSGKNYNEMSDIIIENVGGADNVVSLMYCVTRLHFQLKDTTLVNCENIENCPGVLGSLWLGEQFQVIVGGAVNDIYNTIRKRYGV